VIDAIIEKHNGLAKDFLGEHELLKKQIQEMAFENMAIKQDLAAIHAHYRSELCGDCCHVDVCSIFPKVKYGFECEERTICMIEIETENTTDETEISKEENPDAKD